MDVLMGRSVMGGGAVFGSGWHPAIHSASYSSHSGIIIDNSTCDSKMEASSLQCQWISNTTGLGKNDGWIVQFESLEMLYYYIKGLNTGVHCDSGLLTLVAFVTVNNNKQLLIC